MNPIPIVESLRVIRMMLSLRDAVGGEGPWWLASWSLPQDGSHHGVSHKGPVDRADHHLGRNSRSGEVGMVEAIRVL